MSRNVLITGGNRGIGLAIAEHFKAIGDNVIVTYRSGNPPANFESVIMDVTSTESVESGFNQIEEKYGAIEVLVANAGITRDGLVLRMSDADFEDVFQANLMGSFELLGVPVKRCLN